LAGILKHLDSTPGLGSVLKAVEEGWTGGRQPLTSNPIHLIFQQMTELSESFRTGDDFLRLGTNVFNMIGNTARACFYFLYVIEPLWARKARGLEVRQSDIDRCLLDLDSNNY
jgi:hypothetical protein